MVEAALEFLIWVDYTYAHEEQRNEYPLPRLNNAMNNLVARNWFHGEDAALSINRCADTQVRHNIGFQPGATEFKVQTKDNTNVVIEGNANKENKG